MMFPNERDPYEPTLDDTIETLLQIRLNLRKDKIQREPISFVWAVKPSRRSHMRVRQIHRMSVFSPYCGGVRAPPNGMMSGTEYVAANGPAWASPRSLGSPFGCRPVVKVGPTPLFRFGSQQPPTPCPASFLPEKLMACVIATCSYAFGACACRQVKPPAVWLIRCIGPIRRLGLRTSKSKGCDKRSETIYIQIYLIPYALL